MMTQPPDLDATSTLAREAKARADRATPGPWVCGERWQRGPKNKRRDTHPALTAIASVGLGQCVLTEHDGGFYPTNDQKFIASARTDVPALADAVLALVEMVRVLERNISEAAIDAAAEHVRVVAFLEHQSGLRVDDKSAWAALLGAAFAIKGREHDKCLQALQASLQARAEASSGEIHPATPSASPR